MFCCYIGDCIKENVEMNKRIVLVFTLAVLAMSMAAAQVGAPEAEEIAFAHAGVARPDVLNLRTRQDREDGHQVYKVEFRTVDGAYEYEVLAADGRLVSYEFEMDKKAMAAVRPSAGASVSAQGPAGALDGGSAFSVALGAAGIDAGDVVSRKIEHESGRHGGYYDIEFTDDLYKWEFEIGDDGKVLEGGYELRRKGLPKTSRSTISDEEAARIVSDIVGGSVADPVIFDDYDDGRRILEIHASRDGLRYDIELDAADGTVYSVKWNSMPV